jgi:hypothetical protein
MKTYELKVNLNEGQKFTNAEWKKIGTIQAKSKAEAEENFKKECYGEDCGLKLTVDINRYSGMTVKAFTA